MRPLDRRTMLALGPLALAGCGRESPYFGKTRRPARQELICATNLTAAALDPAKSADFREGHIIRCLFEGLTNYHPKTMEPMAGIATHYEASPDGLRFTFFLRGHSQPRGMPLPNTGTLRHEYVNGILTEDLSRERPAPPDGRPVYWSDGKAVTAHDVVYSWRRVVDPVTASPYAYLLYYIENAQAVNAGRLAAEKLAVRALDDFTMQVDLRAPTAFFLRMLSWQTFRPVARQAIDAARRSGQEDGWTEPGCIVSSGPFLLKEQRSRDKIVLVKNPRYYEAGIVALEEVSFLLAPEPVTSVNLYKSGEADVTPSVGLPPVILPSLSGKRDFCTAQAFGTFFPCFNTRQPPFDNVLIRYAFNMTVDKKAMASVFGTGRIPAWSLVPPIAGYQSPESLPIEVDGNSYDVLEFNPTGARRLLARAGFPEGIDSQGRRLTIDLLTANDQLGRLICEVLQQQWQANLSVNVKIASQEFNAWLQNIFSLNYRGITAYADWGFYLDPNWFLDQFVTGSAVNASGWADPRYDTMLAKANATLEPALRMERLAECERYLLRAMPFFPIYHDVWAYPQKPYVRGIGPNVMDVHSFKYAWIDTNWRPQ